jgi:hypothetical protein
LPCLREPLDSARGRLTALVVHLWTTWAIFWPLMAVGGEGLSILSQRPGQFWPFMDNLTPSTRCAPGGVPRGRAGGLGGVPARVVHSWTTWAIFWPLTAIGGDWLSIIGQRSGRFCPFMDNQAVRTLRADVRGGSNGPQPLLHGSGFTGTRRRQAPHGSRAAPRAPSRAAQPSPTDSPPPLSSGLRA